MRYTLYAPIYNVVKPLFAKARKQSIDQLDLQPGSKVLIVGGGTGLDLEFIPEGVEVTFTDVTPEMVKRAKSKYSHRSEFSFDVVDGSKMPYEKGTFHAVILHLIVAVIPAPDACISEVNRVITRGGKVAIMDKFRESAHPSFGRKLLNPVIRILFTDINRKIEDLTPDNWTKVNDEGVLMGRTFRAITYIAK